ncbi:MAG TPA: hypothetical protein VFS15_15090 [Kofleriaceae bacterium]|nr:hypothetical protein [Kofleriaceae bacterium]
MRYLLVLVIALAACGKKQAPKTPAPEADQKMEQESEEQDVNTPAEGEEPADMRTSDPQEGGE